METLIVFLLGLFFGGSIGVTITAITTVSRVSDIEREKEDQIQLDYLKEYNKKHNKNITKTEK